MPDEAKIAKWRKILSQVSDEVVLALVDATDFETDLMEALYRVAKAKPARALGICTKAFAGKSPLEASVGIELLPEAWRQNPVRVEEFLTKLKRKRERIIREALSVLRREASERWYEAGFNSLVLKVLNKS